MVDIVVAEEIIAEAVVVSMEMVELTAAVEEVMDQEEMDGCWQVHLFLKERMG